MIFLENFDFSPIPLKIIISDLSPISLFLGKGPLALEVAVFSSEQKPSNTLVHKAFNKRRAGRATPILVVIIFPEGVILCGTIGEKPRIFILQDFERAERVCANALMKSDRNSAINYLANSLPSLESKLAGIYNESFLSNHQLSKGLNFSDNLQNVLLDSNSTFNKSGCELIKTLGFESKKIDNLSDLLFNDCEEIAIAIYLNENEIPQLGSSRFNNFSPVSYGLTKAEEFNLQWVLFVKGDILRIYNTKNIGVGKRGRSESFVECQISLLTKENSSLIWLLFSSEALRKNGTLFKILEESKRFTSDLANDLRERIYDIVVPKLAMGISKARNLDKPTKDDLAITYEMALLVLFRLLFISYAEDRDFLPYSLNEFYREASLKETAKKLTLPITNHLNLDNKNCLWEEVKKLWDSINEGNSELGIPAYGGNIFSKNKDISEAGFLLENISLPNKIFEEILRSLLLTKTDKNNFSPIDFRSLSVREFGTIYEGLLVSELSVAKEDLSIDKKGSYVPTKKNKSADITKGQIYLHNRSGARKSSGSYYTPDFAVENILENTLEPALDEHLDKLSKLSDADRTENLFKFSVADISMGSGHFLVAAIDLIERKMTNWLRENQVPGITRELNYLRDAALLELGDLSKNIVIDDSQLLRRMIARRCIYGVDLNPFTVQLARLSIWIHTFVPGLPLSLLDHNLIQGNSLIGIDSLNQIKNKFDEGLGTIFEIDSEKLLGECSEALEKLAKLSESSIKDIKEGRKLYKLLKEKTKETKALCDLIIAKTVSKEDVIQNIIFEDWNSLRKNILSSKAYEIAKDILKPLEIIHFPISFPEVFGKDSNGFNVIVGNPPFEKLHSEEHEFWSRYFPGLRGFSQSELREKINSLREERSDLFKIFQSEKNTNDKVRKILIESENYPELGKGHPDLYKAFSWRFLSLLNKNNARLGVVLPRTILSAKGTELFRKTIFKESNKVKIITLKNRKNWVFKSVSSQLTICLISAQIGKELDCKIDMTGLINSNDEFQKLSDEKYIELNANEVLRWTESSNIPCFSSIQAIEIFLKYKRFPLLGSLERNDFKVKLEQEINASTHRNLFTNDDLDSVQVYKGECFDIWNPFNKKKYASIKKEIAEEFLQAKRLNSKKLNGTHNIYKREHIEDIDTLAFKKTRIAFRDIARATDPRTLISAILPPNTICVHNAPVVHISPTTPELQLYLIGIFSSLIADWYIKLFVEAHVQFYILYSLPIPNFESNSELCERIINIASRLSSMNILDKEYLKSKDCKLLDEHEKNSLIYELDALVAHLYKLEEKDIIYIFKNFHIGLNYEDRLENVLRFFHSRNVL